MRAFLALELDDAARDRLRRWLADEAQEGSLAGATWTSPANLHLTLQFLGEIDPQTVAALGAMLPEACRGLRAPRTQLSGVSAFPSADAARSVFAALADETGVRDVFAALERETTALALPRDPRTFHPHVTLARCKPPVDARAWAARQTELQGPVQFPRCTLFESRGGSGGSVYVPVAAVDLA